MTTVFVLTREGVAVGIYASKSKARQEMNRHINEGIKWYAKNINPSGAAFAEQNLRNIHKVVEMEVEE